MRILGIDPGSQKHSWAVIDVDGRQPGTYVEHGECETVDEMVTLLRGTIAGARWRLATTIDAPVTLLAIECPTHFFPRGDGPGGRGAGISQASHLMLQQRHVGELVRVSKDLGLDRVELTATQWRLAVVGIPGAKNAAITAALATVVQNMPKRCNEHARDAMGVALAVGWGVRAPVPTVKEPKAKAAE